MKNPKEILNSVKILLGMDKPVQEEVALEEISTDVFTSEEEATQRAEELGCELTHTLELEDCTVAYMPCESHEIYEEKVANLEEVTEEELTEEVIKDSTEEEVILTEESTEEVQATEVALEEDGEIEETEALEEDEDEMDYKALYEEALEEIATLKTQLEEFNKAEEELQIELSTEVEELTHSPEAIVESKPLSNVQLRNRLTTNRDRVMAMISNIK